MSITHIAREQEMIMIKEAEARSQIKPFDVGSTVSVKMKIVDGASERITFFRGIVISKSKKGLMSNCVVRKISNGIGVERLILIHSPLILDIEVLKKGRVKRANLSYLRKIKGTLKVKEKFDFKHSKQNKEKVSI